MRPLRGGFPLWNHKIMHLDKSIDQNGCSKTRINLFTRNIIPKSVMWRNHYCDGNSICLAKYLAFFETNKLLLAMQYNTIHKSGKLQEEHLFINLPSCWVDCHSTRIYQSVRNNDLPPLAVQICYFKRILCWICPIYISWHPVYADSLRWTNIC